jgi:hypothetical protein
MTVCIIFLCCSKRVDFTHVTNHDRFPSISPDYAGITLPFNMAPLNFCIKEAGKHFYIKIYATSGNSIDIFTSNPSIEIPQSAWHVLLKQNIGRDLNVDIYVMDQANQWNHFKTITNHIAEEEVDAYLTYRLIQPTYLLMKNIGIYQRYLSSFKETLVFNNRPLQKGCFNCHTYCWNDGEKMLVHIRKGPGTAMMVVDHGKIDRIDTITDFNKTPGAYPAWYPDGSLIALSVNQVKQYYHGVGENRDVFDKSSDLIVYNVQTHTITSCPQIASSQHMETWPAWTPDGKFLYFCSAPSVRTDIDVVEQNPTIKYDLMRISYDNNTQQFGPAEIVLASSQTGLSVSQPKISPDGRFLLFCMASYGTFPVYRPDSDLYLMDLSTSLYHRLDINSDRADSYHCWSSNSRWFVFSSKRDDGLCARPYFAYIDQQGNVHKPFVLPQKDPAFYDTYTLTFNVPELSTSPVRTSPQQFVAAISNVSHTIKAKLDPKLNISKTPVEDSSPWLTIP